MGDYANARKRKSESGIAMMVALLSLVLLSAVGVGLMYMANNDTMVSANYRETQNGYFAARAGLEEARQRLMPDPTDPNHIVGPSAAPTSASGIMYIVNPDNDDGTINPWNNADTNVFRDTQLCWENFQGAGLNLSKPSESGLPCSSLPGGTPTTFNSIDPGRGTRGAIPYKWVRISTKVNQSTAPYCPNNDCSVASDTVMCWDGSQQVPKKAAYPNCETNDANARSEFSTVWRLTSLALTRNGSRRMLQMEVANDPPIVTNGAVQSKSHVTLHGSLSINGWDYCSCLCTYDSKGAVVGTCTDRPGKVCDRSRWGVYSSEGVYQSGGGTVTSARVPPIAADMGSDFVTDIPGMIDRLRARPETVDVRQAPYNWVCSGTPVSCGSRSSGQFGVPPTFPITYDANGNPIGPNQSTQVTYIPGNVRLTSSAMGNGILIVDGDLDIHGGFNFYGLVLVRGVVTFSGGGSDNVNLQGGLLAGENSIDLTDGTTVGGSAVINYDNCALQREEALRPPRQVVFRELAF